MNTRYVTRSVLSVSLALAGLAMVGCDKSDENTNSNPTNSTANPVGGVSNTPNAPSSGGVGSGMAGSGTGMTSPTTAPSTLPSGTPTANPNNGMRGELSTDRAPNGMPQLPKGSTGNTTTSPIH